MFCKSCGKKVNDESKYCNNCGKEIIKEPMNNLTKETQKTKKNHYKLIVVILVILTLILSIVLWFKKNQHIKNNPNKSKVKTEESTNENKESTANNSNGELDINKVLLPIEVDGKYGYMNKKGDIIINPQYDQVEEFSEGLAGVLINDRWGFIDVKGNLVIEPTIERLCGPNDMDWDPYFRNGYLDVYEDGEYYVIDKKGNKVTKDYPSNIYEGFDLHKQERDPYLSRLCTDINNTYSEGVFAFGIVTQDYENISAPYPDIYGYMDMNGNVVIQPQYEGALPFNEGLARVYKEGKVGFIDKQGNEVIQIKYDSAYDFSEGLAWVCIDDTWGLVDKKGNIVVEPWVEGYAIKTSSFSNGLAAIAEESIDSDNKYLIVDYINKKGEVVLEDIKTPLYISVYSELDFKEGLLPVYEDGKVGYINTKGEMVIEPSFESATSFKNGVAKVCSEGKNIWIDTEGNVIVPKIKRLTK